MKILLVSNLSFFDRKLTRVELARRTFFMFEVAPGWAQSEDNYTAPVSVNAKQAGLRWHWSVTLGLASPPPYLPSGTGGQSQLPADQLSPRTFPPVATPPLP